MPHHKKVRPSTREGHDEGYVRWLQGRIKTLEAVKRGGHRKKFRPQDEEELQKWKEELKKQGY
jgi:hypothetical protein